MQILAHCLIAVHTEVDETCLISLQSMVTVLFVSE